MKILKFGGSSLGSSITIKNVIEIIAEQSKIDRVIVVVSAVGGVTNQLLEAAHLAIDKDDAYKTVIDNIRHTHLNIIKEFTDPHQASAITDTLNTKFSFIEDLLYGIFLINELSNKTIDKLLSNGELLSSFMISEILKIKNLDAILKNAQDLIVTDDNYTKATVLFKETNTNIQSYFKDSRNRVTVIPGFISRSTKGTYTTLGRGGSDYTAAIIAGALHLENLQIWTDVSGMYTANPQVVKQARPIKDISYQEVLELSHFGAKVLYPPTVIPAVKANITIEIKNTLEPHVSGTIISNSTESSQAVKGISNISGIALLTLQGSGMVGVPGYSKRLFDVLSQQKINVVLITQASSEHSICFAVDESDAERAKQTIFKEFENEIILQKIDPIEVEYNLSIIAIVGEGMKNQQGISGQLFSTLGKNNVNVRAIAQGASERNISTVISTDDVKKALNTVHEVFFEDDIKQVNLFITGVGNVGTRLIEQINGQKKFLKNQQKTNLRIIGLSNSKTMVFNDEGISLNNWEEQLKNGENASLQGFFDKVVALNLGNSVYVDVTADENVAQMYAHYLRKNIAVVACNKIACSGPYVDYEKLKNISLKYNVPFLFETNVGAGLPVISTLNNMVTSGDKINTIEAVLSGSLNFIFNNFNATTKFYTVVKRAQTEGYSEPDPRIDLSGIDVARKILILIRESGVEMNLKDITSQPFLTKKANASKSIADFYNTLIEEEAYYQSLFQVAEKKDCKLKFVASYKDGKASIGLREIPRGHPFYNLEGKDNIVMFYTERYPTQPLIIKGAGAGADVTASGIFADIITASKQ